MLGSPIFDGLSADFLFSRVIFDVIQVMSTTQGTLRAKRYESFSAWRTAVSKGREKRVLFVPTMGALHPGHAALVEAARRFADGEKEGACEVVVSIFINPTQFDDAADFGAYPSSPDADVELVSLAGADAVVFPRLQEMYPDGVPPHVDRADFGSITSVLEGAERPGHFDGVVAVVRNLFQWVKPSAAFFGEKDWQQLAVVRRLVDLEFPGIDIHPVPTVREPDGLAMSSRNRRLCEGDRALSPLFAQWLRRVAAGDSAEWGQLCADGEGALKARGFEIEYLTVRNAGTLEEGPLVRGGMRVFGAVRKGGVRLIDNVACTF